MSHPRTSMRTPSVVVPLIVHSETPGRRRRNDRRRRSRTSGMPSKRAASPRRTSSFPTKRAPTVRPPWSFEHAVLAEVGHDRVEVVRVEAVQDLPQHFGLVGKITLDGGMVMDMSQPTYFTLSDIPGWRSRIPIRRGSRSQSIRITAFGVNAYTAARQATSSSGTITTGIRVTSSTRSCFGHAGAARFVVDGLEVDASAGTFVEPTTSPPSIRDGFGRWHGRARDRRRGRSALRDHPREREDLASVGVAVNPA